VEDRTTLGEVFESEHGELPKKYNILVKTSADDNPKNHFSVNPNLTITEINRDFRMRYLYFECEKQEESLQELVAKAVEITMGVTLSRYHSFLH
jgi:phage terminase large subunit-like protein